MDRRPTNAWIGILFATLVAVTTCLTAAAVIPYHGDELSQVRTYERSVPYIVRESTRHAQPPLDYFINSIAQKAFGIGDIRQRLLSIIWSCGSLIILGLICIRLGFGIYSASGLFVLALSPVWVEYSAYARPYALPVFLILLYILLVDCLLEGKRLFYGLVLFVVTPILAFSRLVEPAITIGLVTALIVLGRLRNTRSIDYMRLSVVGITAIGSIFFVTLPVFVQIQDSVIRSLTGDTQFDLFKLQRLVELPGILASSVPFWPAAVCLILIGLCLRHARCELTRHRVFWVLLGVPLATAVIFFVAAKPDQMYYERYTYFWFPFLAFTISGTFSSIAKSQHTFASTSIRVGSTILLLTLLTGGVWELASSLSKIERANYAKASVYIKTNVERDSAILFDAIRPVSSWRPWFYGRPRYISDDWLIRGPMFFVYEPGLLKRDMKIFVLLLNATPSVQNWKSHSVDSYFTFYENDSIPTGPIGAAETFLEFASSLPFLESVPMRLASARLYQYNGRNMKAKRIVDELCEKANSVTKNDIRKLLVRRIKDVQTTDWLACSDSNI